MKSKTVLDRHIVHNLGGYLKGEISVSNHLINLELSTTGTTHITQVISGLEDVLTFLKEEQTKITEKLAF